MRFQSGFQSTAAFWAFAASSSLHVDAERGLRRQLATKDCTIMAAEPLALEGGEVVDMILECEVAPEDANGIGGIFLELVLTETQRTNLKGMIKSGQVTAGRDLLQIVGAEIDDKKIKVPPGLDIVSAVRKNPDNNDRRLAITKGEKPMLLVKVTDVNGLAVDDSPTLMSDEVFGTGVDPSNLKTALAECSWNQLTVKAGLGDSHEVAQGVIAVSIPISLVDNTDNTIQNAVTTAVQNLLGHGLPGPYHHVLYSLHSCYNGCGWAAYAYVNSWLSVYQSTYYRYPGVLVHELGHNFNLAHSGGLDGATYTDHTCSMGNPHYSDDGFQCFNPAKNFQLDWYDAAEITEDPRVAGFYKQLTLVGIGEYPQAVAGGFPVTVRLSTGSADYFVGFNRATGPNSLNVQGDNQVSVIQVSNGNGIGYSQSYLKALLSQGQSYNIPNYAGTGRTVSIAVNSLVISEVPGKAVVTIKDDSVPTTSSPTTSPPTKAPVVSVNKYICTKNAPLAATICVDGSLAGGICSSENVNSSCGQGSKVCWWASCPAGGPSPPPPTPTTSPPTRNGPCAAPGTSCVDINVNCCNGCSGGKPANRVCL